MSRFSDRLQQKVEPIWEQIYQHPFVTGLGSGSLPEDSFRYYMKQDYIFLIDYAKLFGIASAKAHDPAMSARFAALQESTLNEEMALHRSYAQRLGISREELETSEPSYAMLAYTSYMLKVAWQGSLAELVSALLPCMWSYAEIGQRLAAKPGALEHPFYGEWVKMYSSREFGQLAQWLIDVLNELGAGLSEAELARLETHFLTTSRMEYLFWEMAYRKEYWPCGVR